MQRKDRQLGQLLVFTIPKRLRIYCRYDRSLLGELARAAWVAPELALDDGRILVLDADDPVPADEWPVYAAN